MIESLLSYGWYVAVILIVLGFVALVKGADYLVDGASAIAKRFGISDLVIGLTVVAFGTSMPEFVVNMVSVAEGTTDLAITNIVGSNIINTFVILGLTALVYPIASQKRSRDFDIPLSIIAGIVVFIAVWASGYFHLPIYGINRISGVLLLLIFCYFLYNTFRHAKEHPEEGASDEEFKRAQDERYVNCVTMAIEMPDGSFVTGRSSRRMVAAAAMVLNAVKALSGSPSQIPLIGPNIIQSIAHMKQDILKVGYTSLNLDETLIGLAISSATNPAAQIAMEKLNDLRGCEVHMTHIVTPGDEAGLRRLGCRFTSDPFYASNALFNGEA